MISIQLKNYDYYTFEEKNSYGQPSLSQTDKGTVKMAINLISEVISENAIYSDAQYVGLTFDKDIDSKYVIQYGDDKLKVLYVNPLGRYRQVFLARM